MLRSRYVGRVLIGVLLCLTCTAIVTGQPRDFSQANEVLKTTLVDLLVAPGSPVEETSASVGKIIFDTAPSTGPISTGTLITTSSGDWRNLTAGEIKRVNEAWGDIAGQTGNRGPQNFFAPLDDRIVYYTAEMAGRDKKLNFWQRPQVFHAYPVGFSRDATVAMVKLTFSWSGNMHGAEGICVLAMRNGKWNVIAKSMVHYV